MGNCLLSVDERGKNVGSGLHIDMLTSDSNSLKLYNSLLQGSSGMTVVNRIPVSTTSASIFDCLLAGKSNRIMGLHGLMDIGKFAD